MKTVFITGVSKGIGLALSNKFLKEGYKVIGTSTNGSSPVSHENLKVLQLDLSDQESISTCVQNLIAQLGDDEKISIMINNAGILADEDDTAVITEKLRKTLEVNLIGTIDLTERILKTSIKNDGHILNISSMAGSLYDTDSSVTTSHYPYHYPAYRISKAALNMYTRTLAMRLSQENTGITVSSVHPGWVKTGIGGEEAPVTPEEAADDIFNLAISEPETGQFWFKGEKCPW